MHAMTTIVAARSGTVDLPVADGGWVRRVSQPIMKLFSVDHHGWSLEVAFDWPLPLFACHFNVSYSFFSIFI